ncbi:TonB-dependent receptor domain-containing protein [Sphingorhabdus sp.]|uniref:TonB-dependent receptor domain-containing protein n=1 Tax=Sphingorhabdus sp. TaxID=1902408 RepID=UPI0035B0D28D
MKLHKLALYLTAASLAVPVAAQDANAPQGAETATTEQAIVVTGSRIKRDPNDSSLPLTVITNEEISRNSISSPEQLLMFLPTSGTGPENLASNADVVSGAQRGTNGLSSANLRGQGNAATLVLLNGRRVAAHGLSGSAVDVNQIPFAAMERVEVLKDGASAIYGTDAVGGVINFITKKDYTGLGVQGFVDIPEAGGGQIYRLSGVAGYGDLQEDGFNVMAAVAYSWNKILRGSERGFVNGNQPDRGLSIDTRGTPFATAFGIAANPFQTPNGTLLSGLTLTAPNGANAAAGGINILDLPGGAGCESMDGGMAYDWELWNSPTNFYACAWDTGRAVVLQQPINTLTYFGSASFNFGGDHTISAEVTGSDAESSKQFSNNQYSANNTTLPIAYPLNANTAATYNQVFNAIRAAFTNPAQQAALDARYGRPIAYRWRCVVCGPREYKTDTKTFRAFLGVDGPLWDGWDYRAGASYAKSEASSVLGSGYHYRGVYASNSAAIPGDERGQSDPRAPIAPGATVPGIVGLLNAGILNPFSLTQTPEALAALDAVSAEGTVLYGGKYEVRQVDASISGPLFSIWGGDVQMAAGVDFRRETYSFNGSPAAAADQPDIFNVAFDNVNALTPKKRNIKAAYAEILVPLLPDLEITGAIRVDDYSGFGTTTNPKISAKFTPFDWLLLRGSYNTSFRVPTFNQIYNGLTISATNSGANIADPLTCPTPTAPNPANPGCALITPEVVTGGNLNLGPETAKQFSVGVVVTPAPYFSASVDWWSIAVDDTIQLLSFRDLLNNYSLFENRFIRDAGGAIDLIDSTWANAGARRTQGLEVSLRGGFEIGEKGLLSLGLDGTYLLKKKEKLIASAPFGPSLIGVFSFNGDLGLKWKHNAFIGYTDDNWALNLTQIFRKGYKNQALPGIAAGLITRPNFNEKVKDYVIYNASVSFLGLGPNYKLTAGIKNVFDTDPPFAISYDSLGGSGGNWEPRVADPRGRSFTLAVEAKF